MGDSAEEVGTSRFGVESSRSFIYPTGFQLVSSLRRFDGLEAPQARLVDCSGSGAEGGQRLGSVPIDLVAIEARGMQMYRAFEHRSRSVEGAEG